MTTAQDGKQVRRRITVYEPLSMIAAEHGWRAAFIGGPGDDGPGYVAEPLIGWGIFDVTERPAAGQTGPTHHHGRQVHGIVALEDEVNAAPAAAANFWRYLAPGDELTEGEVTAEQEARAGHWKGVVMTCNRRDCPHPGDHAHLPWRDERMVADVLLELRVRRREGVLITTGATTEREREDDENRTSAGPGG